jgi:hypothetical protein
MTTDDVKRELLAQINRYLNNEISKEEYADVAETLYTCHAELIEDTMFYNVFTDIVPDACLIYVDEPGLTEELKEILFHEQLANAYLKLKDL